MCYLKTLPSLAAPLVGVTVALVLCIVVLALSLRGVDLSSVD